MMETEQENSTTEVDVKSTEVSMDTMERPELENHASVSSTNDVTSANGQAQAPESVIGTQEGIIKLQESIMKPQESIIEPQGNAMDTTDCPRNENDQENVDSCQVKDNGSSSDSSDDSSDDEDDDGVMLSGKTQEEEEFELKQLMENDASGRTSKFGPLTEHEKLPDEVEMQPLPDDVQTSDEIDVCGTMLSPSERQNCVVVQSVRGGEGMVEPADIDSVICTKDRKLVGRIEDVFGPVVKPFYLLRLMGTFDPSKEGFETLEKGQELYIVKRHGKIVNIHLLDQKGSDASNIHDEEPDEDQLDYSDDEQEALAKSKRKDQRRNNAKTNTTQQEQQQFVIPSQQKQRKPRNQQRRNNNNNNAGNWQRGPRPPRPPMPPPPNMYFPPNFMPVPSFTPYMQQQGQQQQHPRPPFPPPPFMYAPPPQFPFYNPHQQQQQQQGQNQQQQYWHSQFQQQQPKKN